MRDLPLAEVVPNTIGYFLDPDHMIITFLWLDYHLKVDCILVETSPRKIGYLLEHEHWVNSPLAEVGPMRNGYFLYPYHTMVVFLGLENNSRVGFLLMKVRSKNIK